MDSSEVGPLYCIANTYRTLDYVSEAIEKFEHILTKDPEYLLAHVGLARSYAVEVKNGPKPDWQKALVHHDFVIGRVENGLRLFAETEPKEHLKTLLKEKACWLRKLGQYDEARKIYLDILQDDPDNDEVRLEYIVTLREAQSYSVVVETLDELDQIDEKTQKNRLVRFFHAHAHNEDCHSTLVHAVKQIGSMLRIKGYYQKAVDEANKDRKTDYRLKEAYFTLNYHLAALLWNHGEGTAEKEEAIKLWEQLTDLAKAEGLESYSQVLAARRLARTYITEAVKAGRDSPQAAEMLDKFKTFAPKAENKDDDDDWGIGLSPAQTRSLLGRYYSRIGDVERAREQLRPDLEVGIKLLSDDDQENDYQGYQKLADAFMYFGDDANSIAAWSLIQPTKGLNVYRSLSMPVPGMTRSPSPADDTSTGEPSNADPADASRLTRKLAGPLWFSCDGRCGKMWTYSDDAFVCRECIDVQFDAPCLEKLQRGELGRDICDKNHKFLHVPAWTLESANRAEAKKVLVGDKVLDVDEWLESIKKEWGLEESKSEKSEKGEVKGDDGGFIHSTH
jgi:tetratricopeptide (TPR) repeat protein